MKKIKLVVLSLGLLISGMLLLVSCGGSNTSKYSFYGTYYFEDANGHARITITETEFIYDTGTYVSKTTYEVKGNFLKVKCVGRSGYDWYYYYEGGIMSVKDISYIDYPKEVSTNDRNNN